MEHWNSSRGIVKKNAPYYKELNHYIEHMRQKAYQAQKDLEDEGKPVTPVSLKNRMLGIDDESNSKKLVSLYDEHNLKMQEAVGKGVVQETLFRHQVSRNHVAEFIRKEYKSEDLNLRDISHEFITKYYHYLRTVRNCANNTTVKYIMNLNKIIRIAINNDWIRGNPFRNIKFKLEEVNKEFLTQDELNKIMNKEISIPRIQTVRDIFVFCCFTGLAYSDVKSLSFDNLVTDNHGKKWIKKRRKKTNQWSQSGRSQPRQRLLWDEFVL